MSLHQSIMPQDELPIKISVVITTVGDAGCHRYRPFGPSVNNLCV
jgi:hypothetical protein